MASMDEHLGELGPLELLRVCNATPHEHEVEGVRLVLTTVESWSSEFVFSYTYIWYLDVSILVHPRTVVDNLGITYKGGSSGYGGQEGPWHGSFRSRDSLDPRAEELTIYFVKGLDEVTPESPYVTVKLRTIDD